MVRIILCGCNGKMGQVISDLVKADEAAEIVAGIDLYTESKKKRRSLRNALSLH